MPSNIENANISAIKLGTVDMTKGYIGHEEVYPNTREIQSAAFTSTSTLANSGGTRIYRVTGDVGSQYTLSGSNGASSPGVQTLSASQADYSISIGGNTSCGASSRTPTMSITPSGSTVLASGVSTTSSFTQSAGPPLINYTPTHSLSISTNQYPTTTVNGVLHFASGTVFTITGTCNGAGYKTEFYAYANAAYSSANGNVSRVFEDGNGAQSFSTTGGLYIVGAPYSWANAPYFTGSGTWTQTVTLVSGSAAYFTFRPQHRSASVSDGGNSCQRHYDPSTGSYEAWPASAYSPTITRYP